MFAGLGAARIRKLFDEARKNAPSIVFIDELDAVGQARSGHGVQPRAGPDAEPAARRARRLRPARPGRRDGRVEPPAGSRLRRCFAPAASTARSSIQPPDLKGRRAILAVHTRGKPLADDVDLEAIARQTAGLTGADLANICNEAAIGAGRPRRIDARDGRLRQRARAGRRRPAAAPRRHRQGEADPRLPRGRPRARVASRRQRAAEGDDHRPRHARSATCCTCPRRSATSRRRRSCST